MAKSPEPGVKTFDEAVSLTGIGKFNLFVLLATGGSLMCVIIETMSAMFVTPAAQCDLNLSLGQKGLLYSISFFGVVSGSFLWGYLADTKGRKLVTIISLITSSIISIIGSFVSTVWLFILLRYLNGFFVGGSSAIIYAYAGEFHDNKCRPKVVSWIATFVAFGNIYLPGLAWVILPQEWSLNLPFDIYFRPWRLLIIIYSLPSLVFLILVIFLPESPKYLMAQGKHQEAFEILQLIFTVNTGKKREEYPVKKILWEDEGNVNHKANESVLNSIWEQFVPLFKKRFILKTFMVCFLQFAIFLSSSAVIMWYPEILNSMTELGKKLPDNEITLCKAVLYSDDTDDVTLDNFYVESALINYQNRTSRAIMSKVCNDNVNEEVFLTSLVIGCCYAICYITIGSVINIIGARKLLSGFILFTTISGICAQMLNSYLYIQVALCIFLMAATGVGIVNAIVVDLYPTQIRGMALAVSLMFGRFGAMTGSNAIGPILFNFCDYLFYAIAALHAVVIIVIILLPTNKSTPQNTKEIS
ncbi:unnamed protein product [Phyllotreta striolata]|uniref:Major facilitator superfamily (MFS) profile domain-containing protein n=1 Tax=Phyllotreta striolata TaxID=444603 RepID=A0A9N9TWX2_PHYSR|nr:unnamed protein product [Phyllotreta striolata]